jgi:hypothetical protein
VHSHPVFEKTVLPTLDRPANAAMGNVFPEWRRLLFPSKEQEEDAASIQALYIAVLEVLWTAVQELRGR